jgi:hypothetical protein
MCLKIFYDIQINACCHITETTTKHANICQECYKLTHRNTSEKDINHDDLDLSLFNCQKN